MAHKLLLADDSVTIQRVIELTFADEDVDVTTVGDGQLAIDRLDTDPPDIILADVDMPKRDGYEIAAYVKSRPKLAHIPVVLLTGAFEPVDQVRASAAGSTDVLAKPFEPQMVINRVKELLSRKRSDDVGNYEMPPPAVAAAQTFETPITTGGAAVAEDDAVSLDDYFDQLDAAFSTLQSGAPPVAEPANLDWAAPAAEVLSDSPNLEPPNREPRTENIEPRSSITESIESFDVQLDFTALTVVPDESSPESAFDLSGITADLSATPPLPEPMPEPIVPATPVAVKPMANPFASLSAAKAEAAAPKPAPAISDDVIEEIVSRVLRRMSDNVVREAVSSIVSETAERLVQEEIQRIKEAQ